MYGGVREDRANRLKDSPSNDVGLTTHNVAHRTVITAATSYGPISGLAPLSGLSSTGHFPVLACGQPACSFIPVLPD